MALPSASRIDLAAIVRGYTQIVSYAVSAVAYLVETERSGGLTHICCRCSSLKLWSILSTGIYLSVQSENCGD